MWLTVKQCTLVFSNQSLELLMNDLQLSWFYYGYLIKYSQPYKRSYLLAFHHDAAAYDSVYSLYNAEYFIKKIGVIHLPFVFICMSITTITWIWDPRNFSQHQESDWEICEFITCSIYRRSCVIHLLLWRDILKCIHGQT